MLNYVLFDLTNKLHLFKRVKTIYNEFYTFVLHLFFCRLKKKTMQICQTFFDYSASEYSYAPDKAKFYNLTTDQY